MTVKITIPEPCHEDWQNMTSTQKGAFCESCAKEVIDFTTTSRRELAQKIRKGDSLCGRFKPEQLNTPLPSVSQSQFRKRAALLGFTSLLALGSPALAQETPPVPIHEVESDYILGLVVPEIPLQDSVTIKGQVSDLTGPLPGANVELQGTAYSVQADMKGQYELTIHFSEVERHNTLVFQYFGFETKTRKIDETATVVNVELIESEEVLLGEVFVMRKQNFLNLVGNWFRKN